MSRIDGRSLLPSWAASTVLPVALALGCGRAPPPSRFPSAEAALERMRAAQACSLGVTGEGSLDYFGPNGRVRANVLFLAMLPERVRFDVYSPFGATLSTLTADAGRFGLLDVREKVFLRGPANACNIQRFTGVPLPPHGLVDLLRGVSPVLVHEPSAATLDWEGGAYVVRIASRHQAQQEIRLVPPEADYALPWWKQRVRVLETSVTQAGVDLYRVELKGHAVANTAPPREDPDQLEPPLLPSGPVCRAEVPRRLRFVGEAEGHDVVLVMREVAHNPPLPPGVFTQSPPSGVSVRTSSCPGARP
ncbi:MAG TPA: hypothetical protein VKY73_05315 [Polyangiaceae bacterium]|nr:hypothetical protein [Polyangiaceae bacterium]